MRRSGKVAATLLAALLLVGSTVTGSAQGLSEEELVASLEGLEKMYGRTAAIDFSAPPETPSGWVALAAYALEFDSEEHAAEGAKAMSENGAVQQLATMQEGGVIEEVELGLDFEHAAARLTAEEDGETGTVLQVVAQDGVNVYGVFGLVSGVDPTPTIESLMARMHETEVSEEPEVHNADGTSTGGLWAVLPTVEEIQAEAPDLTDIEDIVETPGSATPAA